MRLALSLALALGCSVAQAGVYSDDLAKCLVKSTSLDDKANLVRWIFAIAALHPKVSDITSLSSDAREGMNRGAANLFERLLTESCRTQSQEAIRYEGAIAMQQSFQVLGQVAMQELMTDKSVSQGFEGFAKYLDRSKLEALGGK
jgi:hypothetical protein